MATFVLVHGAQHGAWCWDRLLPELRSLGHHAIAPDLPCDDPDAGIAEYAQHVVAALDGAGGTDDVVLVGHSLGSLTIPVVAEQLLAQGRRVDRLVFLCSVPTGPGPAIDASLADMVTPAFANARRTFDEGGCESLHPDDAITVWFADCEPEDARWAASMPASSTRRRRNWTAAHCCRTARARGLRCPSTGAT